MSQYSEIHTRIPKVCCVSWAKNGVWISARCWMFKRPGVGTEPESLPPKRAHNQICERSISLKAFLAFFFLFHWKKLGIISLTSPSGLTGKAKDKQGWEMAQLSVVKKMRSVDTFILQLLPLGPSSFSQLAFADD